MSRKKSSKSTSRPGARELPRDEKPARSDNESLAGHLAVAAGLVVLLLLAWSNSFGDGFALDNRFFILLDARVHQATSANIGQILSRGYVYTYNSGVYRPLTTLSFLFNYAILGNGDQPAGYHWFNILLHVANAFLLYLICLRLLRKFWPAVFIAMLWAVHPVLTESVTNIVGRADLLAGFSQLSGFLMYLKSTESAGWKKAGWLAGLMAITTLGVFSKESAVSILGVIVLYELTWWRERKQLRGLLIGCAALAPPLLLLWYERTAVLSTLGPRVVPFLDNPLNYTSFFKSRLTALAIVAKYLWLLVWPLNLTCDYSYNQIPIVNGNLHDWIAWISVLAVLGAAAAMFKYSRAAFFFVGFALISFVPVSNLLFFTGTIMAERFLYLPAIGFAACLVLFTYWVGLRTKVSLLPPIVLCLIVAAFAVRTWERNFDWHDDIALWTAATRSAPNSAKVYHALASALIASDRSHSNVNEVITLEEKTLAILDPLPDAQNEVFAYATAGDMYSLKGDMLLQVNKSNGQVATTPASLAAYRRALEILTRGVAVDKASRGDYAPIGLGNEPEESEAIPTGRTLLYSALADTYARLGNNDEAYTAAAHAASLSPQLPYSYVTMGEVRAAEGRKKEAVISLLEGLLMSGDQKLLPFIHQVYESDLGTEDCTFLNTAAGRSLNTSCRIVHEDICKASDNLIKVLEQDQNPALADKIKRKALEQYQCSPSDLQ